MKTGRDWSLNERVIETVRAECLDWTLILGRRHLDADALTYAGHDNRGRPHRELALAAPLSRGRRPNAGSHPTVALGNLKETLEDTKW